MLIAVLLLIFLCVALAAYTVSIHLFPGSLLDAFACTILLFVAILILTMMSMGMIGQMFRLQVACAALLLALAGVLARSRMPVLIAATSDSRMQLSVIGTICAAGLLVVTVIVSIPILEIVLNEARTLHVDGLVFEIPNVVNFIQLGTLWNFDGLWSYYPYNYGMLFAWGPMFTGDYSLLALIHLLPMLGILLYSALLVRILLPSHLRLVGGMLVVLGIIALQDRVVTLFWVGKTDLFLGMCTLAAIYYFLRYWFEPRQHEFYFLLVGLALGLGLGSKLSGVYYLGLLAAADLLILVRSKAGIRVALRHALLASVGIVVFAIPWLLRTYPTYHFDEWDRIFFEWGWGNSIANLYDVPVVVRSVIASLPWLLVAVIGMALIIWPASANTFGWIRRTAGVLVVAFVLYCALMSQLYFAFDLGILTIVLALLALLLLGRLTVPSLVTERVSTLGVLALFGFIVLIGIPFAAWSHGGDNYTDPPHVMISFRYNPAGFPLLLATMVGIGLRALPSVQLPPLEFSIRLRSRQLGGVLAALVFTATPLVRYVTYDSLETLPISYVEYPELTQVYSWARHHLKHTSIYVFNLPGYLFYGDGLTNRVYQFPYDLNALRYVKDWNLEDAERYIAQNHIKYVAFGYLAFSTRLTRDVLNDIRQMRTRYPVVFEDDQSLIFATGSRMALSTELDNNSKDIESTITRPS